MRIIHCADIHLDSALSANFTPNEAAMRRHELLVTFLNMVEYAKKENVRAIIIAGDLFDSSNVSFETLEMVKSCIDDNENIDFLYLCGNHEGSDDIYKKIKNEWQLPNLKLFENDGCSYRYGNVLITGINNIKVIDKLAFKPGDINIAVMHLENLNAAGFAGKNIDYLALGHIHKRIEGRIDKRGEYVYCGCLEARGFDECGQTGFELIDISENTLAHRYVPFGKRHVWLVTIDVTEMETPDICQSIKEKTENLPKDDMVKVELKGEIDVNTRINKEFILKRFQDEFYGFRVEDKTVLHIKYDDYTMSTTLMGSFINLVKDSNETEDMKNNIIKCGISALMGRLE